MLKENQFEQAVALLEKNKTDIEPENNFLRDSVCWQTLTALADTGDVDKVIYTHDIYVQT